MTKQHPQRTRPLPNVNDPLSEPTWNRRLWALYLRAGYNRSTWAEALGLTYVAVDDWDTGKAIPKLDSIAKAAELVGASLDEIYYGRNRPASGAEPHLSDDGIRSLLFELRASTTEIEALGEHARSAAGQFQRFTRTYVASFIERYRLARVEGHEHKDAISAAKQTAANARANVEANALKLTPTISAPELEALGSIIKRAEPNAAASTSPQRKRKRA